MFFRHPVIVSLTNKLNTYTSYVQPLPDASEERGKRRVLLLRCHPVPESYSTALAAAAERGLRAAGHEVRVRSLYGGKDGYGGSGSGAFPPLLTTEERRIYNDTARATEVATPQVLHPQHALMPPPCLLLTARLALSYPVLSCRVLLSARAWPRRRSWRRR